MHCSVLGRWFLVAGLALGVAAALAQADPEFTVDDIEVCPASASVVDPEFDSTSQRMVFVDKRLRLKVLTLKADGTSASPQCAGTVVDSGLAVQMPGNPRINGPEWGRSQLGLEIFYTKRDTHQQPALASASFSGNAWIPKMLGSGTNRGLPLASVNAGGGQPQIMYHGVSNDGSLQKLWRDAHDPQSEAAFPGTLLASASSAAPRWVRGQRALTMTQLDAHGVPQAVRYVIDTGEIEVLTTGASQKNEVWMWPAPEFRNEMVFFTVADGCCLLVYRQIGGVWRVINSINAFDLSVMPYIYSPQPFVYKGRSYVSMYLSRQKTHGASQIWIAAIDPSAPLVRQISDPDTPNSVRSEPEFMSTTSGAYVYYNLGQGSELTLRRANTGL